MIFTEDDKTEMSDELGLVGTTLDRAIAQALIFAEGQYGAQRSLEITRYTDTLDVANNRVFLPYLPIVVLPAPVVQTRYRPSGLFMRSRSTEMTRWTTLNPDDYEIDRVSGELTLFTPAEQVKVEYSAGFGFQEPLLAEEERIKTAIVSILSAAIQDSGYSQGIKEFSLNNFYSVKFASTGVGGVGSGKTVQNTAAQDFLIELQKYRPQTYVV